MAAIKTRVAADPPPIPAEYMGWPIAGAKKTSSSNSVAPFRMMKPAIAGLALDIVGNGFISTTTPGTRTRTMTGYTLSPHPHGEFEPSPRWVRVYFNGQLVADSRNMMLLRENNRLPVYFFPKDDVQWDCLQPSDHKADPGPKGDGVFWHIGVAVDGVTVAESHRPWLLFETGLPTRYYVPKHDARLDLLEPSETDTRCPYKGEANLYSIRIGEKLHRDLAWTYRYPMLECLKIQGLLGFLNEKVDLYEDGEPLPRPDTAWS